MGCLLLCSPLKRTFYVREKIRTPDTLVRSQVLYPAELHAHNKDCCSQQRSLLYDPFMKLSTIISNILAIFDFVIIFIFSFMY